MLKSFPNLKTSSIHTSDSAGIRSHLGGWLSTGDAEIFSRTWEAQTPGSAKYEYAMYKSHSPRPRLHAPILNAIKFASSNIQELRSSHDCAIPLSEFTDA
jgi:hypothetical protein